MKVFILDTKQNHFSSLIVFVRRKRKLQQFPEIVKKLVMYSGTKNLFGRSLKIRFLQYFFFQRESGIYKIQPNRMMAPVFVFCQIDDNGGWTVDSLLLMNQIFKWIMQKNVFDRLYKREITATQSFTKSRLKITGSRNILLERYI